MAMPTAGDDDIAWFDALLPDAPGVTRRSMFGNLGGFVDGQMFLALLGDRVAVRLDPASRDELLAVDGTALFEPMPGRPMREYVVLPTAWKDDITAAERWIDRSMAYAAGLPPQLASQRRRRSRWRSSRRSFDDDPAPSTPAASTTGSDAAPAEDAPLTDPAEAAPIADTEPVTAIAPDERDAAPGRAAPRPTPRPVNAETPSRAHRAARNRATARRTTTRSAGRARRPGA